MHKLMMQVCAACAGCRYAGQQCDNEHKCMAHNEQFKATRHQLQRTKVTTTKSDEAKVTIKDEENGATDDILLNFVVHYVQMLCANGL